MEDGLGYIWTRWHDWFGFNEALRYVGEKGPVPNTPEAMRERGFSIAGSVDTVARGLQQMIDRLNPELIVPWIAAGPVKVDKLLRSNELLVEKVLPKLGIELDQFAPSFRKDFDGNGWQAR